MCLTSVTYWCGAWIRGSYLLLLTDVIDSILQQLVTIAAWNGGMPDKGQQVALGCQRHCKACQAADEGLQTCIGQVSSQGHSVLLTELSLRDGAG